MKQNSVTPAMSVALAAACAATTAGCAATATSDRITGTPGSPSATMTIGGEQLPAPDLAFSGVIKDDALQSKPW